MQHSSIEECKHTTEATYPVWSLCSGGLLSLSGEPVSSPDAPNDLGSKWSAMEWIYMVGLGSCLILLLHNGYRNATITFISEFTKLTSNVKTSSKCSRSSQNIMQPLHSNSCWKDPSCCHRVHPAVKIPSLLFVQLWWVVHFRCAVFQPVSIVG